MQITVDRKQLAEALSLIAKVAGGKKTAVHPAVGRVKIVASEDTISLFGTDLDQSLQIEVPVMGVEGDPKPMAVEARYLAAIADRLPEPMVTLRDTEAGLEIASGGVKATLPIASPDDIPEFACGPDCDTLALLAFELAGLIEAVLHAAADDPGRPALQGVLFEAEGSSLTAVATDGNRLALARLPLHQTVDKPFRMLVPAEACRNLLGVMRNPQAAVSIQAGQNVASFRTEAWIYQVRLLEAVFPNYGGVLDTYLSRDPSTKCSIQRDKLIAALERASALRRSGEALAVQLTFDSAGVTLHAEQRDVGEYEERLEARVEGHLTLGVQAQYLLEAAESLDCDELHLAMAGPMDPLVVDSGDRERQLALIMPMRLER